MALPCQQAVLLLVDAARVPAEGPRKGRQGCRVAGVRFPPATRQDRSWPSSPAVDRPSPVRTTTDSVTSSRRLRLGAAEAPDVPDARAWPRSPMGFAEELVSVIGGTASLTIDAALSRWQDTAETKDVLCQTRVVQL